MLITVPSSQAAFIVGTYGDDVWTHNPSTTGIAGGHIVTATAYDYSAEQFELPVQASGWNFDGNPAATSGTLIHSGDSGDVGKYWAYGDLKQAELTADSQYWNIKISVVGDYEWTGDSLTPESAAGLKGKYYVYFGQFGTGNHWAFNIDSGTGLSTTFDTAGGVKLFEDESDPTKTPPYGTGITTTRDDNTNEANFTGYNNEISTNSLTARTLYDNGNNVFDIEYRYDFLDVDGPISQQILENLDYLYIGVAVSNPSATSDLFANDHFTETGSTSAEYDTLRIDVIPEPSTAVLVLLGLFGLAGRRRR